MLHLDTLFKTDEGWKFSTEADLEDFVWRNIGKILGLTPLKRQYSIQNDCCDIIAIAESGQLVIIELKNVEDRYVVQQLTRYYHSLFAEKPFGDLVKYNQPIRLIAITPNFHRHNHIDQAYNKLLIEFFQFEIKQIEKGLIFNLKNQDEEEISSVIIPYSQENIVDEIISTPKLRVLPRISRAFEKSLDERHPEEKEIFLRIRKKILEFDERMAEVSTKVVARYGHANKNGDIPLTRLCAEFYSRSINKDAFYDLILSLWLPIPSRRDINKSVYQGKTQKILIRKFNEQDLNISLSILINPNPKSERYYDSYSLSQYLKIYKLMTGKEFVDQSLDVLIEIALDDWQTRCNDKK
ncbi:MAG: endonuclease NucS domain-containing protein [Pseudanabaena sp. ELA607]